MTDSQRKETVKSMIDYAANLICCLLNFTVAQYLESIRAVCVRRAAAHLLSNEPYSWMFACSTLKIIKIIKQL